METINLSSLQYKLFFFFFSVSPLEKRCSISKLSVSSPIIFWVVSSSPPLLCPQVKGNCWHMYVDRSVSHEVQTSLTVIPLDKCVCACMSAHRCVHFLHVYVCLCGFGLATRVLTATCWVSLVLRASRTDDTVTHASRKHPVQSAVICNYLFDTLSGSQTHCWVYIYFLFDEKEAHVSGSSLVRID